MVWNIFLTVRLYLTNLFSTVVLRFIYGLVGICSVVGVHAGICTVLDVNLVLCVRVVVCTVRGAHAGVCAVLCVHLELGVRVLVCTVLGVQVAIILGLMFETFVFGLGLFHLVFWYLHIFVWAALNMAV